MRSPRPTAAGWRDRATGRSDQTVNSGSTTSRVGAPAPRVQYRTQGLCREWRPLAGTRACSLNGQPNSKAGDVGETRRRTGLVGGLRTRRRYTPTPLPAAGSVR